MRFIPLFSTSILSVAAPAFGQCPSPQITKNENAIKTAGPIAQLEFGKDGSLWHDRLAIGARDAAYVCEAGVATPTKLVSSNGVPDDKFASSVSLFEDWLAVGAYDANTAQGSSAGAVYMFRRTGPGQWNETQILTDAGGAPSDLFGFDLSLWKGRLVVGAWGVDDPVLGENSGAVFVYELEGSTWVWKQTLKPTNLSGTKEDRFGIKLSIWEDRIVVAATHDDPNGSNSGSVYVFEPGGSGWTQVSRLFPAVGNSGDLFGNAVSIFADRLVVGSPWADSAAQNGGVATLFERQPAGNWVETQTLTAGDACDDDHFGNRAALYGDALVIGANNDDHLSVPESGSAYTFHLDTSGQFRQASKLVASNGQANDEFGVSVAIWEKQAAVGAQWTDAGAVNAGSVYLFDVCGCITPYGPSCPGFGDCTPNLSVTGCPTPGGEISIAVTNGEGSTTGLLVLGPGQGSTSIPAGCQLLVLPLFPLIIPFPVFPGAIPCSASGAIEIPLPAGVFGTVYIQVFLVNGPMFRGATNGVEIEFK